MGTTDEVVPTKYRDLAEQMVDRLIKYVFTIVLAITVSYSVFGLGPLYMIVFEGARVTFLGTELPFTDIDTDTGYWMNMIQQAIFCCVAFVANVAVEIAVCLACNAIATVPNVFNVASQDLHTELRSNGMSLNAKFRIRNILIQVQDFNM